MQKIVKLSEDGFVRATEISKLLAEGWTLHPDPTDPNTVVAEKADAVEEGTGSKQLLWD